MKRLGAILLVAALFVPLSALPVRAETSKQAVAESLTCQCGCGLTVANCNHLNCGFAVPVREEIVEALARGETGDQILARYVDEYGEKVLSSPVAEGFNLLAWIGPYLAVLIGGILIVLTILRWSKKGPGSGAPRSGSGQGEADGQSAVDRGRLDAALQELET